jgi:hypothetical protein
VATGRAGQCRRKQHREPRATGGKSGGIRKTEDAPAKNVGFQKIRVNSDCLSPINKVRDGCFDRYPSDAVVQDIKSRVLQSSYLVLYFPPC